MQSAETTRFLGSGSTCFVGFGSTHTLGCRTGPGSSSQPSSSEGMGVMSGELSSLTNMVLEKTQFMVNLFNLPSILLFFILLLGPTIILVPALSFLRNWLSFESTEKQKMINLWMLVVSWNVVIRNLFLHLASDLLLGSWLRMVVETKKQNKKINF